MLWNQICCPLVPCAPLHTILHMRICMLLPLGLQFSSRRNSQYKEKVQPLLAEEICCRTGKKIFPRQQLFMSADGLDFAAVLAQRLSSWFDRILGADAFPAWMGLSPFRVNVNFQRKILLVTVFFCATPGLLDAVLAEGVRVAHFATTRQATRHAIFQLALTFKWWCPSLPGWIWSAALGQV